MRNRLVGGAVAALAAVSSARAQRVHGTLTDSATHEPVSGAVVTVVDSAGAFLARTIADAGGRFSVLRLPAARRLRVVRIGYRPRDRALAPDDSIADLAMQPVAAMLDAVAASDTRICPGRSPAGDALDLWEQARAGLLASLVERESSPPRVRLRTFRRTLEPVRRASLGDTIEYRDLVVDRSFVAARPPWAFAEYGYMRESIDGSREYLAPDEGVLLDPTFAATHCLRLIGGDGPRAGEIGIAFDPVPDPARDTLVDVSGVLWLDRANIRLRGLEFHYTNLEPEARGSGGEITFATMPTGVPFIEKWVIHSTVLAWDAERSDLARRPVPRSARYNTRTLGYRETGGQIAAADWPDGTRWSSTLPKIAGVVVNRDGSPAAGARVWLRDTRDTARTDAAGRFEFAPMPPGAYVVAASDSTLAREGVSRVVPTRAMLFNNLGADLRLEFHPRSEILPMLCPAGAYKPGSGVVLARVVDAQARPVPGAEIEVENTGVVVGGDTVAAPEFRRGITGDGGRFAICGAHPGRPLIVRAFRGREAAGVSIDEWGEEVASVTLVLRPPVARDR